MTAVGARDETRTGGELNGSGYHNHGLRLGLHDDGSGGLRVLLSVLLLLGVGDGAGGVGGRGLLRMVGGGGLLRVRRVGVDGLGIAGCGWVRGGVRALRGLARIVGGGHGGGGVKSQG